jgi:selenocysteine lyase/cysteine desulfurase
MLEPQKHRFTLPPGLHYLNCAYMAPLSRRVEAAGSTGLLRRRDPTSVGPEDFFGQADAVRDRFSRLLGSADSGRTAILPAVSYGMAVVARNLPLRRGSRVIVAAGQFPSNVYPWRRLAQEHGATLHTVEAPPWGEGRGRAWNERILEAIDADTALLALPEVHWADGTRFALEPIGVRAREVGAALVIDGTQSVGALPFDLAAIRPDAVVCAGYKWLLGPYGLALGWFGERFDGGTPLEENWINREGSEDFAGLVRYRDGYQPGAVRYDVGERSDPIRLPMMAAALDEILDWGVEDIQEYASRLTAGIASGARDLGFGVEEAPWRAGHLVGLHPPDGADIRRLAGGLAARRVAVSLRGDVLRVAPHLYNDAEDVQALLDALRSGSVQRERTGSPSARG